MARSRSTSKSKTPNAKSIHSNGNQVGHFRTNVAAFVAAFAGAVVAVPVTLAVALPAIHNDVTSATAGLASRPVQVRSADATTSLTPDQIAAVCGQPSVQTAVAPVGQVLGASMVTTPSLPVGGGGGGAGGGGSNTTTFVKKLVNGVFTTKASISNTGPESNNVITTTNTATTTVTNNNDIHVSTQNDQSATSGDATTKQNTTAGSTSTGDATNQNQTDLNISVSN